MLHLFLNGRFETEILYKCTDGTLEGKPILSDKDAAAVPFAEFESPFT